MNVAHLPTGPPRRYSPWRQPRGKWMVYLVNSRTNATRIGWHLWEIDLRFAPGLPPGWRRSPQPRNRPTGPLQDRGSLRGTGKTRGSLREARSRRGSWRGMRSAPACTAQASFAVCAACLSLSTVGKLNTDDGAGGGAPARAVASRSAVGYGAGVGGLHPPPSTLNPQPYTLNPQPSTLNPPPSTLNPQPSTLKVARGEAVAERNALAARLREGADGVGQAQGALQALLHEVSLQLPSFRVVSG